MNEQLESFADDTPIELPSADQHSGNSPQPEGLDTFDDDTPVELSDSQTSQLEDKEEVVKDEPKKEESKKEDEGKKDDSEESEKEPEARDEEPKEKAEQSIPKGRAVRLKDADGNTTDVDLESTIKMKIDGKNEIVQLKDLRDNYSSQVSHDRRMEKLESRNEEIESNSKKFETERNELVDHLTNLSSILDDPDKSPFEALNYLVDMSGRNTLEFNKKVMAHMADEVRNLDGMDDVERELYWRNKELDAIRGNQAAKEEKLTQEKTHRESLERVNQLRESQGVTEDLFVKSHEELIKDLGYKPDEITPEVVVNYAVMKPHYENAEAVVKDVEEDLSDSETDKLISTVANTLKNYPKISKEKALEVSLDLLGWDYERENDFKELNDKAGTQAQSAPKKKEYSYGSQDNKIESFEDFD